jgi:site-specific DNA recombinase
MLLDGIVRVSKVGKRGGESFISPEVQEDQINGWGRLRGVEIAMQEWELDRTGTTLDRPVVQTTLERLSRGETDGVAVARTDRLSRAGTADALRLVEEIDRLGGKLAIVDIGVDPTTIFGEFAVTLLLALARMQARQIGENWNTARQAAIDRGVFVGGFVPPGYLKGDDGRLRLDLSAPPGAVEGFFSKRAARESWGRCADWLSDQLGRDISLDTARNLIANRTYLGEVWGGPEMVNRKAHPPLVTRSLFEQANAVEGVVPARSGNATTMLSGLIRCAGCRYAMKASMGKSRHGRPRLDMRCKTKACQAKVSISVPPLEELVEKRFFGRVGAPRLRQIAGDQELLAAERRLSEAEGELDAVLDTRLQEVLGGASSERYLEMVRSRRSQVDLEARAVARTRAAQTSLVDADLLKLWPELPLHDRRRLLRSTIDAVFVRPGPPRGDIRKRLYFAWRGEAPELPRSGRRWAIRPFDFPS